jgi:hypothetical protein
MPSSGIEGSSIGRLESLAVAIFGPSAFLIVNTELERWLSSEAPQYTQTIALRSFLFLQMGQNFSLISKLHSPNQLSSKFSGLAKKFRHTPAWIDIENKRANFKKSVCHRKNLTIREDP